MAAKNKFLNAMKMPSIDDMFSSEADRQRESGDLVTEVPLSELHPFVGHPFEVRDDEDMQKLVDSIRENGVLTNLTVRRRAEGGYEIISGHRRFHAAQRAGLTAVKVQVRDIDDDQAIIDMVDSNIQREHMLSDCGYIKLLNQSPDDANDLARLLHISNEEKRYIENAEVGSGLLIVSKTVVPFNNDFPKDTELFRLMDTSPNRKS